MKIWLLLLILVTVFMTACKSGESLESLDIGALAVQDSMTIKIQGYQPQAGNVLQNIFVSNFSAKAGGGQLQYMTARDGLPDTLKTALTPTFGFALTSPESVVTGFADLLLYQAGITLVQQPLIFCAANKQASSSSDQLEYNDARYAGSPLTFLGLRDCDKIYMGLDPSKFDYNGNGIPDYLEMRCGMNPMNPNQSNVSTAGDGMSDIEKCKRHIPIDESYTFQPNQVFAYSYNTVLNTNGTSDITVSNIGILNGGADNFIAMYITETNSATNVSSLYTAFAILKAGYVNKTLQFSYWATAPAVFTDQEILVP
jgi:hypothetical protein